jgi:C4-dicarboxylate-specific signal transduction histidine kinase
MVDLNYDRTLCGSAASLEFVLARSQMTAEHARKCTQRLHPLADSLKLCLEQIAHVPALTSPAAE